MIVPGMYIVNRYEIIEKIGSGGMADVYKAKCHVLNRLVAIKVLKPEYSTDETFVKKFRVEAQSAAGLSHPNIVNVYDVGEDDGIYFIVMELVQGITLKNYIDMKGKLDIREALNISVQIASGLSAAHDNRIIHRDIKPQNIIISRDGKVKVTDFGIAKVADSTTVTTTAAGTVHYISPEQARGGYSDEKSDIYALGITMYEMLTGRVPFDGETNVAVALLHIQGEMVPPRKLEPSIPVSFERVILKCTQKKPERRYKSARALIADLRKVLTNPDGNYVIIDGDVPNDTTRVVNEDELDTIKDARMKEIGKAAAIAGAAGAAGPAKTSQGKNGSSSKHPISKNESIKKQNKSNKEDDFDDEDEDVNPGLTKVLMGLGIVGFIILGVILVYLIGHAAGLFSGGKKDTPSTAESLSESITTTESETEDMVDVPSLLGKTENDAAALLKSKELVLSIQKGSSDEYPEGQIYKQTPEAYSNVRKGSTITVYISTGKETFELYDVSDMDYNQASDKLKSLGLKVDLEFENSDSVEKDKVIRTVPEAGSKVAEGDTITIYASEGKKIEYTTVPDVRGYSLDGAISELEDYGLRYGGKSSDYSDYYDEGEVMGQSVSPDNTVEKGTTVNLTVSLGKKNVSYSASVIVPSPFGCDITDSNGESQVYDEGNVKIVLSQDGTSKTIYDQYTSDSDLPASIDVTSDSNSSGTATLYINGQEFDSWSVSFN